MSKPAPKPRPVGPDGATLVGDGTLTGVVKTSKGYALMTAEVAPDGSVVLTVSGSQAFKQFVVTQQKRAAFAGAMKA